MTNSSPRLLSLDVIRGIAVMGIFSVNIVGMAMIENAYFFPPDYGFAAMGDKLMWAANFILVDGKFRSMFSILFGASMLLVIERAESSGQEAWAVHFPRMIVLLLFGLLHFYVLWWGDILANYALIGMIAFVFRRFDPIPLLFAGTLVLAGYYGPALSGHLQASAAPMTEAQAHAVQLSYFSSADEIARDKADHASIAAHLVATLSDPNARTRPFSSVLSYGFETLGLMLLGMAGYRSGFLTGSWSRARYAIIAAVLVSASLALFGFATWRIVQSGFDPRVFVPWDQVDTAPMHPFSAIGYMALIMLIFPRRSAVAERFAAVGRTAFTNYLGSTIIGTGLFIGTFGGLYGALSRGQVWLIVPLVWLGMLLWSKLWLDRFRYGPFEWLWRSLSRREWQPMRLSARPNPAPESPAA
ncbi:MAG: DUF418 domain-containing protein [Croceibacterium sp.]